jgi:hypothetical protein
MSSFYGLTFVVGKVPTYLMLLKDIKPQENERRCENRQRSEFPLRHPQVTLSELHLFLRTLGRAALPFPSRINTNPHSTLL